MLTFERALVNDESSSEESDDDDCPCSLYEEICTLYSHVPYVLLSVNFNSITLLSRGVDMRIVEALKSLSEYSLRVTNRIESVVNQLLYLLALRDAILLKYSGRSCDGERSTYCLFTELQA